MRISARRFSKRLLGLLSVIVLSIAAVSFQARPASAHVKWFAKFDVAGQPRVLERVLTPDLFALCGLSLALLLLGCMLERTSLGEAIARSLDRVTAPVRLQDDLVLRATCGFFLISLWNLGGTILTPELKTGITWIPQLQLAMAATLLFRPTMFIAAIGLVCLYGYALAEYGVFHLLDYPIFIGVAAYLAVQSLAPPGWLRIRPLDLLRWAAGITLMWASVEKWAYPEWTLPIYVNHPEMTFGYDFELFMQAAGVIEFTLAFALLGTPLVRRAAAFILLGVFIGAIGPFGKIDAIGHSVIIAVLAMLASDDARAAIPVQSRLGLSTPVLGFAAALLTFISAYYLVHAVIFGTAVV